MAQRKEIGSGPKGGQTLIGIAYIFTDNSHKGFYAKIKNTTEKLCYNCQGVPVSCSVNRTLKPPGVHTDRGLAGYYYHSDVMTPLHGLGYAKIKKNVGAEGGIADAMGTK